MSRFPYASPRANPGLKLSTDQRAFLLRRTMPFLDRNGIDRPLSLVLQEVYLQGMRDALQVFEEKPELLCEACGRTPDGVVWG